MGLSWAEFIQISAQLRISAHPKDRKKLISAQSRISAYPHPHHPSSQSNTNNGAPPEPTHLSDNEIEIEIE